MRESVKSVRNANSEQQQTSAQLFSGRVACFVLDKVLFFSSFFIFSTKARETVVGERQRVYSFCMAAPFSFSKKKEEKEKLFPKRKRSSYA